MYLLSENKNKTKSNKAVKPWPAEIVMSYWHLTPAG